ncbi:hypothetical protein ZIOFF_025083 [Zingiber officinale]|uniref:HTH La-type RNA-binding domain-containing protein n=1 Tax=Zingiber officinale TaxID=94328 RepID=A0A8J5LJK4_ZINOF|nr:hypothetical protein ZIOFF_025083 [Zingiber officinale]
MNVTSVIKDGLLIAFSWSIICDTITPVNLFLYGVTFLGVSYYNKGPHGLFSHHIHPPLGFPYIFHELMESKGGEKSSSSSLLHYEAPLPLGYSIEDFLPHGGINKFQSVAYSNWNTNYRNIQNTDGGAKTTSRTTRVGFVKRQDAPVVAAAVAAPVCPQRWLMLVRSCRALEPTKRDDSTVHAATTVEAFDIAVGEEDTVDYEKLEGARDRFAAEDHRSGSGDVRQRNRHYFQHRLFSSLETFRQKIVTITRVFWNNGVEDVALIEYTKLTGWPFRAFSLDTGRLNPETYRFFDTVEKHYEINIEHMFPDAGEVHALVRSKGLFSFSKDGHQECCQMRKILFNCLLLKELDALKLWANVDNLCKDIFLRGKMDDQDWVPVSLIVTFNMVKRVTTSTAVILNALRDSTSTGLEIQTLGLEESSNQATMSRTQTEVALDRGSTSCSCNSQQGRDPAQLEELCRSGSNHEIGSD